MASFRLQLSPDESAQLRQVGVPPLVGSTLCSHVNFKEEREVLVHIQETASSFLVEWYLIEQQRQRLLLVHVSGLELVERQEPRQRQHRVLHVHYASLLLVNVGSIHHDAPEVLEGQRSWLGVSILAGV